MMKRSTILAAIAAIGAAAAGCHSEFNTAYCQAHPTDTRCPGADSDAAVVVDAAIDAVPPAICLGTGAFQVCLRDLPTTPTTIGAGFNTSSTTTCLAEQPPNWLAQGQPEACFVVGTDVTFSNLSPISIRGPRPLVVVATGTVTFNGPIDLAAHFGLTTSPDTPPGFSVTGCGPFSQNPTDSGGAGGGAGGSLGRSGGNGGSSANSVKGGITNGLVAMSKLHAGCIGQHGGLGDGTGGGGGWGGGAIYVIANTAISLQSGVVINASGAGGSASGVKKDGGGGGGSGGMIWLIAPSITMTGSVFLFANGGSGASGGSSGSPGMNGLDASSNPLVQTLGPLGTGGAGSGGAGYGLAGDATAGGNGTAGNAGGGGGGGAGSIIANQSLAAATVSPASQLP